MINAQFSIGIAGDYRYRCTGKYFAGLFVAILLCSCSVSKQLAKSAKETVLKDSALINAHVGISVFDPSTGKYLYDYQGDKYFVPASNTKLPTCYAAMKYLGDSLVAARVKEGADGISLYGTGDPSFLHPDFKFQPLFEYLKTKSDHKVALLINQDYNDINSNPKRFGSGWSWSDYDQDYMAERSFFPVYGNVARFQIGKDKKLSVVPTYFSNDFVWFVDSKPFTITRTEGANNFLASGRAEPGKEISVPFTSTLGGEPKTCCTVNLLLSDTLGYKITLASTGPQSKAYKTIHSQPTDSLLKPMMHRSDNFFAEQTLLMVANEMYGFMNERNAIDSILRTTLKDLPQPPRWVDGSGLSRYNLFSPRDFVTILNKMKNEFGMERLKNILATGNQGTLEGLYIKDSGCIFAKTGTLSGVVALSGFVYTKKNRLLIFSMLVNNHRGPAGPVRKAYQKFIQGIREN
jgi:D-alanyl-D-alanine carboxypeptidase/D-alanyl-D-alanine-endopeptidase (penicillin-binding protein 4)